MGAARSRLSRGPAVLGICVTVGLGVASTLILALGRRRRRELQGLPSGASDVQPSALAPESAEADEPARPSKGEAKVLAAVDRVLDEWLVTDLHRAAAKRFIQTRVANADDPACSRVRQWLMLRINGKVWEHGLPFMCHTPENIPGVRCRHVWPREDLPWLAEIEAHYPEILAELLTARSSASPSGFQPYRDPIEKGTEARVAADGVGAEGVDRGAWNVLYLILNHKRFEDNCERFPATLRAIQEAFPRHYSHAFFSALTPGTHIVKHTGPSNRMLRAWLPLSGLEGFRLRVGDTIVEPKAGEAFVWDHSFEHEAWHEGSETRLVLIVDIWHPDLTDPEVNFLRALQNCRLRAGQALAERCERTAPEEATYFEIVERARSLLTDDDWWVIKAGRDQTTRPT